ncbi:DUF4383 domain-containing protein [Falsibacillus pallidus]|uniref:Uncharacterized protein DUF4383 n=1 Tax=Falsibacillus pallidus TaxID=493781 RepID=A0A370G3N8_9BACI|nr:DUF4383 domain-containing protein [Falsibacillus pallidus]RDI38497.1 uncharacterized protein DUF4383 [Falsibacillus pallidus]
MAQKFTKGLGVIFILLGIVGFILPMEGIFHLTPMHNIVHLASGIIALIMSGTEAKAALYAKVFGFVYLLVAILGLFTHEFAGIIFLISDNILHFIIAFASIYIGFASKASKPANHTAAH